VKPKDNQYLPEKYGGGYTACCTGLSSMDFGGYGNGGAEMFV
jgi:hypothetical protein